MIWSGAGSTNIRVDCGSTSTIASGNVGITTGDFLFSYSNFVGSTAVIDEVATYNKVPASTDCAEAYKAGAGKFYPF